MQLVGTNRRTIERDRDHRRRLQIRRKSPNRRPELKAVWANVELVDHWSPLRWALAAKCDITVRCRYWFSKHFAMAFDSKKSMQCIDTVRQRVDTFSPGKTQRSAAAQSTEPDSAVKCISSFVRSWWWYLVVDRWSSHWKSRYCLPINDELQKT